MSGPDTHANRDLPGGASSADILARVFDNVPEGIVSLDNEFAVTSINKAALSILDIPRARAQGSHGRDVLGIDVGGEGCPLRRVMDTGRSLNNHPARFRDGLGRLVFVTLSVAAIRDEQNRTLGCVASFVDLGQADSREGNLPPADPIRGILTGDPAMKQLFEILPTISRSDSSILIFGETGTGKNLMAKTIHRLSARFAAPMVTVNCAALPETLLESELFGYKAGAFTGAHRDKPGRFAAAQGGTLFLDEIGDIPLGMQVKLLRVLQEKVFERLGEQVPIPCDVRFVAATHRDLSALVAAGKFRRDLYYRINVLNLEIPPLRNRKGDIPRLAQKFVEDLARDGGRSVTGVSSAALELLMRHNYPGNVRELQNIIEHACVMCLGRIIDVQHLPRRLQALAPGAGSGAAKSLQRVEGSYLMEVLERNGWHRGKAAAELGIHRTTLQRKIKNLQLLLPVRDGRSSE